MRYGFKDVVIDSRTGLNPRKNFILGNGKNNYITIKDIYNGQINITDKTDKVDDDAIQIIKKRSRIIVGDILFVSIGRIGETAIVTAKDDTWDVNESVFVFTLNRDVITPEYFCMLFQSRTIQKYLMGNSSGSTFKSIKMNQLEKMTFDLPSIEVQEEITAKLSKTKTICKLRTSELAHLEGLIKARFVEMFGDPEENPFAWEKHPLSNIIINANNGMARRGNDSDGSIVMRLVELQDGYIDYSAPNRIILNDTEKNRYRLLDGDFLFARVNGNPDNVGRCAVFHELREPVYHNDHIIRVHFNDSVLDGVFASALINSAYGKRQMKGQIKTSAGQYTISQDGIGAIVAILPPIQLQKQFAAFVSQINKSKAVVQAALDKAQLLFDSLMQQYFG